MVAIRNSHLINPKDFVIETWCSNLQLPPQSCQKLTTAWQYIQKKAINPTIPDEGLQIGIEMLEILYELNMDIDSLITALLFPAIKFNAIQLSDIQDDFNGIIYKLIKGVLDMDNVRQLNTSQPTNNLQIDNIRHMLLAMVDDFRCVIIKLAERISFLRAVDHFCASKEEQIAVAKECQTIYAPLANRLGIGQLKWELEDYCFHHLHPEQYRKIASLLQEKRLEREQYIADFINHLKSHLIENINDAQIYGRPKHIYSIWRKMQSKHLNFESLFDVRAVRIIVPKLEDCYSALSIVHSHFKHIATEFDDYIANPKPNGYQSIHTVVLGSHDRAIEVQIRTQKMHDDAELGVAAHWKYKEGAATQRSGYEEKTIWLRKLLAWQEDISQSSETIAAMRQQIFDDRVYVFTPKGEVIDLPTDSTPLDFAYAIHSEIGHRCIGAKIAGRIVPFTYKLQMGDQIEIITQKTPNPSRDWLNSHLGFIHTSRARAKIINWFKNLDRDKNLIHGKELLDAELAKTAITLKQIEQHALAKYNFKALDDLYVAVGAGDVKLNNLINFLQEKTTKPSSQDIDDHILRNVMSKNNNSSHKNTDDHSIIIEGIGNLMHHIARCCKPIPGDHIMGFITQGRGISVHRDDCEQLLKLCESAPERCIKALWNENYTSGFSLNLNIIATDRNGLLRDITTILANEKISVMSVASRSDIKRQLATINMEIQLNNIQFLAKILGRIEKLDGVIEAKRG